MSSPIWTPDALSSEAIRFTGQVWRLVEAQHRVSTLKLVDSLADQALLEDLIEEFKPRVPAACKGLHYLLATPFRYDAVYPTGSRFRRAGRTPGVFYASDQSRTAVAEMAFYRLLFFAESPATPWPADAKEFTAFAADIDVERAIDLTLPPFQADPAWSDPTNYAGCQDLADLARGAELGAIRYRSVRDPDRGLNLAVLGCEAFAAPTPVALQSWNIRLSAAGVQAICAFPPARIEFGRDTFAGDKRMLGFHWDR